MSIKKNDFLCVVVQDLTCEAFCVAEKDGFVIHFKGALVGEKVKVKVLKVIKNFAFAKLVEVLEPSCDRCEILDDVGFQTGIMPLQYMKYEAQLVFKKQIVEKLLCDFGLPNIEVLDVVGMKGQVPFRYRNKAQIPVRRVDGALEIGLFKKGTHDLIPMSDFYIQDETIDDVLFVLRDILRDFKVVPYNDQNHEGNIRNIIVRRSFSTGEVMIVLVSRKPKIFMIEKIVDRILAVIPNVVSIVQNVQPEKSNNILGQESFVLYGDDFYTDSLLGLDFHISSKSFYQVNSKQTEVLYSLVSDFIFSDLDVDVAKSLTVLDAYCGIGSIGLVLSRKCGFVYGVEIVQDAVNMAVENACLNDVDNAKFFCGDISVVIDDVLKDTNDNGMSLDVVIVDPPRKGLGVDFIDLVGKIQPKKIVYVSCNPKTLMRDLLLLVPKGYEVKSVAPVDMFPMTVHVECVVLMTRVAPSA